MRMYGKIFDSIYKGTLYGQWEAIVTFQQMIVLCDADGCIDMTPPAISAVTSIPLDIIQKGIEVLSAPDPHSRTQGSDGCRIELIDAHRPWGWVIINHNKYKSLQDYDTVREQTKERVRKHREMKRTVTDGNVQKRHTDTDTDTYTYIHTKHIGQKHFDRFWEIYPKKRKKRDSRLIWERKKLDNKADEIITDVQLRPKMDDRWKKEGGKFIPDPTTYLNQERWEDEVS